MDRDNSGRQESAPQHSEQHPVQAALRVVQSTWLEAAKAAAEQNDALAWTPADMLSALSNRIRTGETKVDKAVVVLIDTEANELVLCAAGTLSTLEQFGILAQAQMAGE